MENKSNFSSMNLTIVGLGLIGGSLAKSVRKKVNIGRLWAVDVDENVLKTAKKDGVIDEYFRSPEIPLSKSDIIIFCTYPVKTIEIIKNNMSRFKSNSIITDTSGIKSNIVREIQSVMRDDVEFVGGHPMAGRENKGYEFSHECIFENAEYILTPDENTSHGSIEILTELIKCVGFKKVTMMSPESHDKRIAFTSQLPHIIACILMNNQNVESDLSCIGGSFRDITRVADINSDLWCELICENMENILDELNNFMLDMNKICDTLKTDDVNGLKSMMKTSSLRRKEMMK